VNESAVEVSTLRETLEAEAARAGAAVSALDDRLVVAALAEAARVLGRMRSRILEVNAFDVDASSSRLDRGSLDRLTLTPARLDEMELQLRAMAELPPLERLIERWTTADGLEVSSLRIPVGVVGANFEARPNVALDVASQLLKSLNGGVLRTGSAALATVTALVDEVLRPALATVGLPPEVVGLVRSPDHAGAEALVSLPQEIPLVILRGSGPTTATLSRIAASHGVAVIAHAEGGGVLYLDRSADLARAETLIANSLDRLGVCNRLNLLLVHADLGPQLAQFADVLRANGVEPRGTERACTVASLTPLDVELGHEWANDSERLASVTVDLVSGVAEAAELANRATSGLAAGIVAEDSAAADEFLARYRGTASFWHAPTRFADGFALTGAPETGINVGWAPGPRGPVTYRDLWLRQFRVVGDGSQHR
jgi:glutamate-5-semialdehyde dehydrogenase